MSALHAIPSPDSGEAVEKSPSSGPALFRRLLLATAETGACQRAARLAAAYAQRYGSRVAVVRALPAYPADPQRDQAELTRALEALDRWIKRMRLSSVVSERSVFREEPGLAIARLIRREPSDVLLVGTHAATGMERWLLGSVAEEVTRQSTIPGLVVGPKCARDYGRLARLQTVLYATDLSRPSFGAMPFLHQLQAGIGTRVIVLHAAEKAFEWAPARHRYRNETLRKIAAHAGGTVFADTIVESGKAPELIAEFARSLRADAVVLGIRKGSAYTRAATHLRSMTSKIIAGSPCPVFTLTSRANK